MSRRTWFLLFAVSAGLLTACGSSESVVVVVTATPLPATPQPATPQPTATKTQLPPTPTFLPTRTPQPQFDPVPIGDVEASLRDAGYSRFPFKTGDSVSGYTWIKESSYEQATTWETGAIQLQILHDKSPNVRSDHMDHKFEAIEAAFSDDFMASLRAAFDAYNTSVRPNVSGDPDHVQNFGGDWKDIWAQYYVSEQTVQGYSVTFSVWWWQTTCPPQYLYCYFDQFPGLEFTGDSSFKFLSIFMEPLPQGAPGGSA
jgi:hypothetical protein